MPKVQDENIFSAHLDAVAGPRPVSWSAGTAVSSRPISWESNPAPVKTILALMGRCSDHVRLPLVTPTGATCQKLERLARRTRPPQAPAPARRADGGLLETGAREQKIGNRDWRPGTRRVITVHVVQQESERRPCDDSPSPTVSLPAHRLFVPIGMAQKPAAGTRNESKDGVRIAVFQAKPGEIRVALPDDMAAGDIISGTSPPARRRQEARRKRKTPERPRIRGRTGEAEDGCFRRRPPGDSSCFREWRAAADPVERPWKADWRHPGCIPQPSAPVALDSVRFGPIGEVGRPLRFRGRLTATPPILPFRWAAPAQRRLRSPRDTRRRKPGQSARSNSDRSHSEWRANCRRDPHCADRPHRAANISLEGRANGIARSGERAGGNHPARSDRAPE